ncbi:MAG TPA: hypothetical protein VFK15_04060, partial [Burkholderiales bacterium]|nr:hypothetical protein [Burkholderiales bacterium]
MNAKKTVCMLSAGTMLAIALPAFAERDGPRQRYYDRDDRAYALQHRPVVTRDVIVKRPAVVERRV